MSDSEIHRRIAEIIRNDRIVLFMKGTRFQPQCGFSATVVELLDGLVPEYATVNVLADPALRDAIKEFSSWPTIPQLYVDGAFVGGCDIVREMHANGELRQALKVDTTPTEPPTITITGRAAQMFREAAEGESEPAIRVRISARYHHDLAFEPPEPGDVVVLHEGIRFVFDPMSAVRARGMTIDFVEAGASSGFKIENPGAPPTVKQLSAREVQAKRERGEELLLIDVRTPAERELAAIRGARPLDDALQAELQGIDRRAPLVFVCHHGMRSQRAAEYFLAQGFVDVSNLIGGIDAWSLEVDPEVPRY
jgi:monothiol glutaredoxin